MGGSAQFIVGNTYSKIPTDAAVYSARRGIKKQHDVTIYVDVLDNPDLIERVTFDLGSTFTPPKFVHNTPVPVKRPNGAQAWRFATRQSVFGQFTAEIRIRGSGGSTHDVSHYVSFTPESRQRKGAVMRFNEPRHEKPFRMAALSDDSQFGIELEMSSPSYNSEYQIAQNLEATNDLQIDVIDTWSGGRSTSDHWKLVPDGSITCNISQPDCNRFEVVSPPLRSGGGLSQVNKILRGLSGENVRVNKSCGFHCHVDVSKYSHRQIVKICQQFIKYEDAMDAFMPKSRRTGSNESDRYFQSNARAVKDQARSSYMSGIWAAHNLLSNCSDIEELANVMNQNGRYYKLNLQNLKNGRQPTIEFRQHSSTTNYEKVSAWVRFCVRFCENAANLAPPTPFKRGRDVDSKFEALFCFVIKDRALRNFYKKRKDLLEYESDGPCCTDCSSGRGCSQWVVDA